MRSSEGWAQERERQRREEKIYWKNFRDGSWAPGLGHEMKAYVKEAKTHLEIWEKEADHLREGALTLRSPRIGGFETSPGGKRRKDGMSQR